MGQSITLYVVSCKLFSFIDKQLPLDELIVLTLSLLAFLLYVIFLAIDVLLL